MKLAVVTLVVVAVLGLAPAMAAQQLPHKPSSGPVEPMIPLSRAHEMVKRAEAKAEDSRGAKDLVAQQDMANWAGIQAGLSAFSLLGLGVTVVFAWRTANDSRRATEAAIRSADSSVKAMEVSVDTAKRQLRAYVGVDVVDIEHVVANMAPVLIVSFENTGQTPAIKFVGQSKVLHLMSSNDKLEPIDDDLSNLPRCTVGGGHKQELRIQLNRTLMQNEVADINNGVQKLCAQVTFAYEDIFGDIWATRMIIETFKSGPVLLTRSDWF